MQEFIIYKKMRKQNAEDGVLNYSAWKARIQKNYGKQKENEDFCHYLIQKKRDIESARKDEVGISLTLTVAVVFRDQLCKGSESSSNRCCNFYHDFIDYCFGCDNEL